MNITYARKTDILQVKDWMTLPCAILGAKRGRGEMEFPVASWVQRLAVPIRGVIQAFQHYSPANQHKPKKPESQDQIPKMHGSGASILSTFIQHNPLDPHPHETLMAPNLQFGWQIRGKLIISIPGPRKTQRPGLPPQLGRPASRLRSPLSFASLPCTQNAAGKPQNGYSSAWQCRV